MLLPETPVPDYPPPILSLAIPLINNQGGTQRVGYRFGSSNGGNSESNPFETKAFYSPAELGKLIGKSSSTLARWREKGCGPGFIKMGTSQQSTIRYAHEDVLKWLEKSMKRSTSE